MPVKWTPEKDQLLLLKILETHDLKLDAKKVVEAWPMDQEKPTPRAITERLVKIRQMVRGDKGGLSIAASPSSAKSTPTKPKSPASGVFSTPESAKRKRVGQPSPLKREMDADGDSAGDADHELEGEENGVGVLKTPSKKGKARGLFDVPQFTGDKTPTSATSTQPEVQAGTSLGLHTGKHTVGSGDGSPVKPKRNQARARRSTVQYNMVSYGDEFDDEDGAGGRGRMDESSASDFVPEGAGIEDDDFA